MFGVAKDAKVKRKITMLVESFFDADKKKKVIFLQNNEDCKYDSCLQVFEIILLTHRY